MLLVCKQPPFVSIKNMHSISRRISQLHSPSSRCLQSQNGLSRYTIIMSTFTQPRRNPPFLYVESRYQSVYPTTLNSSRFFSSSPSSPPSSSSSKPFRGTLSKSIPRITPHSSNSKSIPTMKQFLHWKEVTRLYRSFLRLVHPGSGVPTTTTSSSTLSHSQNIESLNSLKQQIQDSFRRNLYLTETIDIQRAIQEGNRQYKQLLLMVSPANQSVGGMKKKHHHDTMLSNSEKKKDKQIRMDEDEDIIGRVGIQWPWER